MFMTSCQNDCNARWIFLDVLTDRIGGNWGRKWWRDEYLFRNINIKHEIINIGSNIGTVLKQFICIYAICCPWAWATLPRPVRNLLVMPRDVILNSNINDIILYYIIYIMAGKNTVNRTNRKWNLNYSFPFAAISMFIRAAVSMTAVVFAIWWRMVDGRTFPSINWNRNEQRQWRAELDWLIVGTIYAERGVYVSCGKKNWSELDDTFAESRILWRLVAVRCHIYTFWYPHDKMINDLFASNEIRIITPAMFHCINYKIQL